METYLPQEQNEDQSPTGTIPIQTLSKSNENKSLEKLPSVEELRATLCKMFCNYIELPVSEVFGNNMTLSQIMAASEKLTNSVDLMETFAKISNFVRKTYGYRIQLPMYPLNTSLNTVLDSFISQIKEKDHGTT